MKYSLIKYQKFDTLRNFGVEFEMGHTIPKNKVSNLIKSISDKEVVCSKYGISSNNNYWHVKDDATCGSLGRIGPKGVEVASYIASGTQDIEHVANVAKFLSFSGCKTNLNCGLHVHADVKDLDLNSAGIVLAYWLKMEPWIENLLPKFRRSNKYCRALSVTKIFDRSANWSPQDLFLFFSPKNLSIHDNEDRRVALNLVNYVKHVISPSSYSLNRSTFELRCPEGSLEYNDVKCWVYLFLNFIETCKKKEMPKNLFKFNKIDQFFSSLGLNHENKSFYIFDQHLHDTRIWILKRLIQNGTLLYKKQAQKKFSFLIGDLLNNK